MTDPLRPTIEVEEQADGKIQVIVAPENHEVIATPLTGFLQVKDPSPEDGRKLKEVWDYVVDNTKSDLESERLWTLRHIEQRLAAPRLGQTRLNQLHQYVTIDRQVKGAQKLRDSLLS